MGVAINFNAIQQVRMDKCIVNSYKNCIRQYVTYLVKNARKFKNFVVDVINMFKPVYIYHLGPIAGTARNFGDAAYCYRRLYVAWSDCVFVIRVDPVE